MRHWFRDEHFRSLLKNSSYLGASRVVSAIAAVVTLAVTGRALGLTMFGLLILIHSYAQAAAAISKFQSWQLIVRYGGEVLSGGDTRQFKQATGFALGLDIVSGMAGLVLAIALLPLIGGWTGIPDEYTVFAMLYCTAIPTMAAAVPSGVLRSLDRFDLISWQGSSYPIARAVLSVIAWWMDAPFLTFLAIWYLTDIGGDLFLWFLSWRELRRRKLLDGIRPTLKPGGLNAAWPFAIQVNLTASLMAAWGPIARLIVGGLLGPASAALYRVAASLADSAAKPADLLAKAFYPQVVRMDFRTKHPWRLMLRGALAGTAVALAGIGLLILGGKPLVSFLFGAEFVGAYSALVVLMAVPLLNVISFPMAPMLYTLDRPDAPLKARIAGTLIYFIAVAPLCWSFGIIGAAVALVLGNATAVLGLTLYLYGEHRRVRAQ